MYDIKLVKLVSGEMVLGKRNTEKSVLEQPALLQTIPTQQGVQMVIVPYGYPFEEGFVGAIAMDFVMYEYATCPDDLEKKYLEAVSNIAIAPSGILSGGSTLIK